MKDKLTISEYAKLRKVTAETLRHYDRIGLFHPIERDPKTGYRYYSILQEEKLGTILELKEIGMSIEEIKTYFDHRNLEQSYALLQKAHAKLQERIQRLQKLEETLGERINHLDRVMSHTDFKTIEIQKLPERLCIHKGEYVDDNQSFSYASLELEKALNESTPLLASNRLGVMIDTDEKNYERGIPFILLPQDHTADPSYIHNIPAGFYACKIYKGSFVDIIHEINDILEWINKEGYSTKGPVYQIIQLDISVTDRIENEVIEIQIPITK